MESTDSLRSRIRDLETECKKLTMDMKLKEEQIRDLEGKCQVRNDSLLEKNMGNQDRGVFSCFKHFSPPCYILLALLLSLTHTAGGGGRATTLPQWPHTPSSQNN